MSPPDNGTMVQIGFLYGLNYPFVADNSQSANQIFAYLPEAIAYGLGISADNVTMHALQPYDTQADLGYITTLALAYIPDQLVNTLALDLRSPVAKLYTNPSASVQGLTDLINPSIPILAGNVMKGSSSGTADGASTTGALTNNAADNSMTGQQQGSESSGVKGSSVGIGVAVVAGAAVYGAAMFWVARRYKLRKQKHQRVSSVQAASTANYGSMIGGGAVMSGGAASGFPPYADRDSAGSGSTVRSARGTPISAPVMTENSLGWH